MEEKKIIVKMKKWKNESFYVLIKLLNRVKKHSHCDFIVKATKLVSSKHLQIMLKHSSMDMVTLKKLCEIYLWPNCLFGHDFMQQHVKRWNNSNQLWLSFIFQWPIINEKIKTFMIFFKFHGFNLIQGSFSQNIYFYVLFVHWSLQEQERKKNKLMSISYTIGIILTFVRMYLKNEKRRNWKLNIEWILIRIQLQMSNVSMNLIIVIEFHFE